LAVYFSAADPVGASSGPGWRFGTVWIFFRFVATAIGAVVGTFQAIALAGDLDPLGAVKEAVQDRG
jgi:hypothetical protein